MLLLAGSASLVRGLPRARAGGGRGGGVGGVGRRGRLYPLRGRKELGGHSRCDLGSSPGSRICVSSVKHFLNRDDHGARSGPSHSQKLCVWMAPQWTVGRGAGSRCVCTGLPGEGFGEVMGAPLLSLLIAFGIIGPPPNCSLAQTHSHLKADLFLNLFPQVWLERSYHTDPMTGPLPRGLPAPDGTLSNKCVCDPWVNSSRAISAVITQGASKLIMMIITVADGRWLCARQYFKQLQV